MELKSYDKTWLPAFKGAFLILFGTIAMLRIFGSVRALAVLFIVLIGMTSVLLISTGILFKKSKYRGWTIASGLINLVFCIYLGTHMDADLDVILRIILVWVLFYAISEIIEAGLLFSQKNAFGALFVLNALLTLLFGYFLHILTGNFTAQGIFYLGIIAFIFGIANELSAYLLSRVKEKN
jgi:uncharacterized membrane protein HdeD (DUF308 family)